MKKLLYIFSLLFLTSCCKTETYESEHYSEVTKGFMATFVAQVDKWHSEDALISIENFAKALNVEVKIELRNGDSQTHMLIFARGTETGLRKFEKAISSYTINY